MRSAQEAKEVTSKILYDSFNTNQQKWCHQIECAIEGAIANGKFKTTIDGGTYQEWYTPVLTYVEHKGYSIYFEDDKYHISW